MAKTRPTKSELEDLWGHKNDDDLRVAAEELGDFTELARQVIRAEMKRRWGTSTGVCAGESTPNTYSRELSGVTPTPEIIDIYRPNERAFGPRPTINTSPIQRRFFQSWRRHWRIVIALCLMLMLSFAGFLFIVAGAGLAQSVGWFEGPLTLQNIGFLMFSGSAYFYFLARRLATLDATSLRKLDIRPPIILLRSFRDDATTRSFRTYALDWLFPFRSVEAMTSRFLLRRIKLEETLTSAASLYGPVIAIGKPGESLPPIGAARDYVAGDKWRERIREFVSAAAAVILVLGRTRGLEWEMRTIAELGSVEKLVIVVPPVARRDLLPRWERLVSIFPELGRVPEELILDQALIVRISPLGQPVVITSKSRLEDDYDRAMWYAAISGGRSNAPEHPAPSRLPPLEPSLRDVKPGRMDAPQSV